MSVRATALDLGHVVQNDAGSPHEIKTHSDQECMMDSIAIVQLDPDRQALLAAVVLGALETTKR